MHYHPIVKRIFEKKTCEPSTKSETAHVSIAGKQCHVINTSHYISCVNNVDKNWHQIHTSQKEEEFTVSSVLEDDSARVNTLELANSVRMNILSQKY